jgi:hypothetical protein
MTTTEPVLDVPGHDRMLKGVYYLDAHVPGWADRINLDTLEMADCADCVVGQLFPNDDGIFGHSVYALWQQADNALATDDDEGYGAYDWAVRYGFDSFEDIDAANAAWKRVIRARL